MEKQLLKDIVKARQRESLLLATRKGHDSTGLLHPYNAADLNSNGGVGGETAITTPTVLTDCGFTTASAFTSRIMNSFFGGRRYDIVESISPPQSTKTNNLLSACGGGFAASTTSATATPAAKTTSSTTPAGSVSAAAAATGGTGGTIDDRLLFAVISGNTMEVQRLLLLNDTGVNAKNSYGWSLLVRWNGKCA
jgi:hypothetical protein